MQVPGYLRQLPPRLHDAWNQVGNVGHQTKDWMAAQWQNGQQACQRAMNPHNPWYKRNIQPLTFTDYALMGSGIILAGFVMLIALTTLGIAAFPLAVGGAAVSVFGACTISRYRVRKHFNEIAWEHADQIRRESSVLTYCKQRFAKISQERGALAQPEFKHLTEDLKELDKKIDDFQKVALAPYFEEQKEMVMAHLNVLKGWVENNEQDRAILEAFEQAIHTVGTEGQNLGELETQKQKLEELQNARLKHHTSELKDQVKKLLDAAQRPLITDSRSAFLEYLKSLQRKWAPHKTIEDLPIQDPQKGIEVKDRLEDNKKNDENEKDKVDDPKDDHFKVVIEEEDEDNQGPVKIELDEALLEEEGER